MRDFSKESFTSERENETGTYTVSIQELFRKLSEELEINMTLRILCVEYGIMRACVISYFNNDIKILEIIMKHLPHLKFKLIDQGLIISKIDLHLIPFTGYDYVYLEDIIESPCRGDLNEKQNVTLWILHQQKRYVIYDIICDKIDVGKKYKIDKLTEKIQKLINLLEQPIELFSEITNIYSLHTLILILERNIKLNYDMVKSLILELDFHGFTKLSDLYESGDRLPTELLLRILYYIQNKFPYFNSREKDLAIDYINDHISQYFRRRYLRSRRL